jgi:hypothetical protein
MAAIAALERISTNGWPSVLGDQIGPTRRGRLGANAVVERTEAFDPLAVISSKRT